MSISEYDSGTFFIVTIFFSSVQFLPALDGIAVVLAIGKEAAPNQAVVWRLLVQCNNDRHVFKRGFFAQPR